MSTQVQAASSKERVRTAHTLHVGFKFMPPAGSLCGVATHAADGDTGYDLL